MAMPARHFGLRLQATHTVLYVCEGGGGRNMEKAADGSTGGCVVMCHWNSFHGPCVLWVWEVELADKCLMQFE